MTFPTHDENLLDLFMTNRPTLINRCEPLPGISDHDAIFVDSNVKDDRQKPVRRKIHLWTKADFDAVRNRVSEFLEEFIRTHAIDTPVDQLWELLRDEIKSIIDEYIPSKFTTTHFNQPWVNRRVKRLKRQKQKCYNKACKTKSKLLWVKFKSLGKAMQAECRRAYSDYMRNIVCGKY